MQKGLTSLNDLYVNGSLKTFEALPVQFILPGTDVLKYYSIVHCLKAIDLQKELLIDGQIFKFFLRIWSEKIKGISLYYARFSNKGKFVKTPTIYCTNGIWMCVTLSLILNGRQQCKWSVMLRNQ